MNIRTDERLTAKPLELPTCVDLFAGAGGFSLGAVQAGLQVRLAVEYNRHACETYKHNFTTGSLKDPLLIQADITSLDPQSLKNRVFDEGEECDVLLGGPPCQGFSSHRLRNAGVDDPRNKLLSVYFDFVKIFAPKVFLMENVPGMLWPRHTAYVQDFYSTAAQHGYDLYPPAVVDARDFGLWQRRKRVFILGVRRDIDRSSLSWPPPPSHKSPSAESEENLPQWVNCGAVFSQAPEGDENDVHMQHSEALVDVFRRTPHNGGSRRDSGRVLPCHSNHNGHKDVYGRIDPSCPAPTMTTACINPSKGRFVHPTLNHGITARQAARIQTFPDSFVFKGGLMAAGQQIGNAVPVQLAHHLLQHIMGGLGLQFSFQDLSQ